MVCCLVVNRVCHLNLCTPLDYFKRIQIGDVGCIRRACFHLLFSAGKPLGVRQLGVDTPVNLAHWMLDQLSIFNLVRPAISPRILFKRPGPALESQHASFRTFPVFYLLFPVAHDVLRCLEHGCSVLFESAKGNHGSSGEIAKRHLISQCKRMIGES